MTAICGFVRTGSTPERDVDAEAICADMLQAQHLVGPHHRSTAGSRGVVFGRALFHLSPEDRHDRQPLTGGGGDLLVADLRIDNREELRAKLGRSRAAVAALSDADILMLAVERWGGNAVDHLVGDYAFALHDAKTRRLILARDPSGQRPLFYHRGAGFLAFATTPGGIHATGLLAPAIDAEGVARYLSDLAYASDGTFFAGVRSVKPGETLFFSNGEIVGRSVWNPDPPELRLPSRAHYVEAFREQLDRAVESRLRGAGAEVAAHLSAGYDSSAVAATAARLMAGRGGSVAAFTAAPRERFDGPVPRGRIADESGVAALTAALHPNMHHRVLRPGDRSVLSRMKESIRLTRRPVGLVCNNSWWCAINEAAAARGATVMLTGEKGNLTISAGGLLQLTDMIRGGRWNSWARESAALLRGGTVSWRGVLANSFGPWTPRPLWRLASDAYLGTALGADEPPLLARGWSAEMARAREAAGRDLRPPRNSRAFRAEAFRAQDPGTNRKSALARWGVDERDPTADRRLAEFCLSLPPDMLLKDGTARPLAREALSDRLPPQLLGARSRGYQMADWYEQITPEDARGVLDGIEHPDAVATVIDVDRLRARIDRWPTAGWSKASVIGAYRGDVLRALSAACFMDEVAKGG